MDTKKIWTGRVTKTQKQSLLQYMHANRALGCGQFSGPDSARKQREEWMAIAQELNSTGGASKNAEQWKRCWIDWKAAVKRNYGALKKFNAQTGNLPSTSGPKKMDELDEQMVQFFATDVFEGDNATLEIGIPTSQSAPKNEEEKEMLEEYLDPEFCVSLSEPVSPKPSVRKEKGGVIATTLSSQFQRALDSTSAQNAEQTALLKELVEEQKKTNILLEKENLISNK